MCLLIDSSNFLFHWRVSIQRCLQSGLFKVVHVCRETTNTSALENFPLKRSHSSYWCLMIDFFMTCVSSDKIKFHMFICKSWISFLEDNAYIACRTISARVEAFCREAPVPSFRRQYLAKSCARVFAVHTLPSCLWVNINKRVLADPEKWQIHVAF